MKTTHTLSLAFAATALGLITLGGCGSDSTSSPKTGYLYDDLVEGIEYSTPSRSGITGADGSFTYLPGEKVTFKLGNLTIGKAVDAAELLTLFDLAASAQNSDGSPSDEVTKMAVLLQSLDSDGDPNNGIQISKATRDALAKLDKTTLTKDTDLNDLLNTKGKLAVTLKSNTIAADHLISSVAKIKGAAALAKQTFSSGAITEITKYTVDTTAYDLTYGNGKLPLAVGSSLRLKSSSNGSLVFYGLTDRGPNTDSPASVTAADGTVYTASKAFPLPEFVPKFVEITVQNGKAVVTKATDLKASSTSSMSGLPLPSGTTGNTGEISLNATLTASPGFSPNGIDPEGIDSDANGKLWISDEYGPFIAMVNPTTGVVERKYIPGDTTYPLPDMLKNRVPNRGMEGLAIDRTTGLVYAIVQTPLDTNADGDGDDLYLTMVELNPASGVVNLYAVNYDKYVKNTNPNGFKAKKIKAGDLMSLGNGKFFMIEQGSSEGGLVNNLVLIDLSNATKLTAADYTGKASLSAIAAVKTITPATRTLVANLRDFGWLPEKAEGLAMIDDQTIAIINDDDFGVAPKATCKVSGVTTVLDPTKLTLNLKTQTLTTAEYTCDTGSISYTVVSNAEQERRTRLWIIKLSKKLSAF